MFKTLQFYMLRRMNLIGLPNTRNIESELDDKLFLDAELVNTSIKLIRP